MENGQGELVCAPCYELRLQLKLREGHHLPWYANKGQGVTQGRHKHVLVPAHNPRQQNPE